MQQNPYLPITMRLAKNLVETEDRNINTFTLEYLNKQDEENFKYMPGQFAELSAFGYGEAPFGIATSPTEPGVLKFSVAKVGCVSNALHLMEEGTMVGVRGPMGNYYPVEEFREKTLSSSVEDLPLRRFARWQSICWMKSTAATMETSQ